MPFTTELYVKVAEGRNGYTLIAPLVYGTHNGETIVVPPGFHTDLVSIPWLLRTFVPHNRRERMPAVVHDYLFVVQDRPLSEVNTIMYEAMRDTNTGLYARTMIRSGLALGSWVPWRKNLRANRKGREDFLVSYGLNPHKCPPFIG